MNSSKSPMEQTLSGGVVGIGQLPTFVLPAFGGDEIRSWDYKGRRALVIWLPGSTLSEAALDLVGRCEPDFQREGAELVTIVRGSLDQPAGLRAGARLHGPVLADRDGRMHVLLGVEQPTLLVTDRHGTLYWRGAYVDDRPDVHEALSWLAYINILEPECGTCVPAWPVEG